MATPYTDVYNIFLAKITDYGLPQLTTEIQDSILKTQLYSACVKFADICKEDLYARNEELGEFIDTLSEDSKEILSELMLVEWLKPQLYKSEFFENALSTKDFSVFSPANLLKEIRSTYLMAKDNARYMMINYSYR